MDPDQRCNKPASGRSCLFMTDSTARQLGYRLLVGSELELLAATNNQESDAISGGRTPIPGRSLVNGPVQVFTAITLISHFQAGHAHAGVAARAQPGRPRPALSYQPVPDRAMDRRAVARGPGSWRSPAACSFTWHRQARVMVGRKHAEQRRRRAPGRNAADDRGRGHRKLTALYKQRGVAPCPTG